MRKPLHFYIEFQPGNLFLVVSYRVLEHYSCSGAYMKEEGTCIVSSMKTWCIHEIPEVLHLCTLFDETWGIHETPELGTRVVCSIKDLVHT
jgi:hypothetical protein